MCIQSVHLARGFALALTMQINLLARCNQSAATNHSLSLWEAYKIVGFKCHHSDTHTILLVLLLVYSQSNIQATTGWVSCSQHASLAVMIAGVKSTICRFLTERVSGCGCKILVHTCTSGTLNIHVTALVFHWSVICQSNLSLHPTLQGSTPTNLLDDPCTTTWVGLLPRPPHVTTSVKPPSLVRLLCVM